MRRLTVITLFCLLAACSFSCSRENPGSAVKVESGIMQSVGEKQEQVTVAETSGEGENIGLEEFKQSRRKILEYQKSLVRPCLDRVLSSPVKCEVIKEDEQAEKEYGDLLRSATCNAIYEKYGIDPENCRAIAEEITLEKEKLLQELAEEHICFDYPNPRAFNALVDIWQRHPCSEAAISVLYKMNTSMLTTYIHIPEEEVTYNKEMIEICDYIIGNYPDSKQTQKAKLTLTNTKYGYFSNESMEAYENAINYLEKNGGNDNSMLSLYQSLANIYNQRCKTIAEEEIEKTGRVPPEALELYNKQYELFIKAQKMYPDNLITKDIIMFTRKDCREMVKKHSPENYRGDPVILEDLKKR